MEIKDYPARNSIDRYEFFKKNFIPKLIVLDRYPIEQQIEYDKNSNRSDYWPAHIPEVNNERL